jgi:hypothetical protein
MIAQPPKTPRSGVRPGAVCHKVAPQRAASWPAVVFSLIFCLFLTACNQAPPDETYEKEIGYRGPARQYPFLAAERMFKDLGYTVSRSSVFTNLPKHFATVITPVQSFLSYGDTQAALDWINQGGHLIVFLSGGEQWRDDWNTSFTDLLKNESRDEEEQRFLDAMNVRSVNDGSPKKETLRVKGRDLSVELRGEIEFSKPPAKVDLRSGDALVSFPRGLGRVTLLAHAHPFRNRYISEADHAAVLNALATMDGRDVVCFLYGQRVSFLRMLWEEAWMAVSVLGVLLLAWLWRHLPRFGPPFTPEDRSMRDFTEHLRLTGMFLWKKRQVRALLEPLQREVRLALARRGCSAEDAAACAEISARTGLAPDRVRLAVFLVEPESTHLFLRTVQDLQTIRAKI